MKIYTFHNYTIFPWTAELDESNEYGYKWYTNLKNKITGKVTRLGFTSLADARKWCKDNYLLGVVNGWIKA